MIHRQAPKHIPAFHSTNIHQPVLEDHPDDPVKPRLFRSVGQFYRDFHQLDAAEVIALLASLHALADDRKDAGANAGI